MAAYAHNLPNELSSFVGRQDEMARLTSLLTTARLVTLAGPGGIGKTRLALRVAGGLLGSLASGVWLVELAALSDSALVADRIADAVAQADQDHTPALQRLIEYVRDSDLLIVLDNCEHVLGACADLVAELLRACARLRVLATSREPLGITGEMVWRVPTLSAVDAGSLFVERVAARQPGFQRTPHNTAAITEICRQLDGIPLALELAAAYVPALGADGVVRRLNDRLRLLVGRDRTAPRRHQTLRAAIDWSYALLGPAERELLDRLSVFAGGATLEAVEGVGTADAALVDLLERLIAKSLIIAETDPRGELRYRLLESVRTYAVERLAESGLAEHVQRLHAAYCAQLAEEAEPELNRPAQVRWLDRLEREHDNLRAALAWSVEHELELGLRIGAALARFWFVRGHLREGSAWLDRLVNTSSDAGSKGARANALTAAGILAWHRADTDQAERYLRASLALRTEASDGARLARTLYELAKVLTQRGDHAGARAVGEQALECWRREGDAWGTAVALNLIGEFLREEGDLARAGEHYEEARQLFAATGDQRGTAIATQNVGIVAMELGDLVRARALHRATLPLKRELGDREGLAASLVDLAYLSLLAGNAERATRLCSFADVTRLSIGSVLPPYEEALSAQTIHQARAALGNTEFSAQWATGQQLTLDDAVAEALRLDVPAAPLAGLTPRQLQVVKLVAQGLTNRELAERLVISKTTADRHVSDVLNKLGLPTRVHLATWAIHHGLRP
ncbi:MAG TPA: tetratricopeptide repeat protein [Chloroflexota bacterium]